MRVYHRRGRLIGESQERIARAIRLRRMPGDVGVSPTTKIPLLLARVRLITLCEVRNVPHDKEPPFPGQEEGARSKTTQGEGMRSTHSWIWHR